MAEIAKVGTPTLSSLLPPPSQQVTGLTAGEALGAFDNVYIKTSDKKVYKATGAAATAPARVRGQCAAAYDAGEKGVTVYFGGVTVAYGSGLAAGTDYFLSGATAGGLADAASTGGTTVIAFAVDDKRVRFLAPH